MVARIARLLLALAASLLLIVPPDLFRLGLGGITTGVRLVGSIYGVGLVLWAAGRYQVLGKKLSPPRRNFDQVVFVMFLATLPWSVVELVTAAAPAIGTFAGFPFAFGMSVALFTNAQYATIDYPTVENRKYWQRWALYGSIGFSLVAAGLTLTSGFSAEGARHGLLAEGARYGLLAAVSWPCGLWSGLNLGYRIKEWSAIWVQIFHFLRKLGRPMVAFAFGYAAIVALFGSIYGAVWRLDGAGSFSGLPGQPGFGDFIYFSVMTAATVGYGDVAPRSGTARLLAETEIILSLAWTIVVFAALMSVFATTPPLDNNKSDGGAGR